jgi:26S proteasome regulatory subunit N10
LAAGFEFGVDPNVDPELALAFQVSIEEERARQEDAAEESSETKSTGQSLTSNDDIVMADAESKPNPYTEDKRNLQTVCLVSFS